LLLPHCIILLWNEIVFLLIFFTIVLGPVHHHFVVIGVFEHIIEPSKEAMRTRSRRPTFITTVESKRIECCGWTIILHRVDISGLTTTVGRGIRRLLVSHAAGSSDDIAGPSIR